MPQPIPASMFREIPLILLVARHKAELARTLAMVADAPLPEWASEDSTAGRMAREIPATYRRLIKAARLKGRSKVEPRRRPAKPSPQDVAEIYDRNFEWGAPTKAVALHFGVPRSTANKWVDRARQFIRHPKPTGRGHEK